MNITRRARLWLGLTVPGRLVSCVTEKCYAIAEDTADIAVRFLGVPRAKVLLCPLGVDTEIFSPAANEEQCEQRQQVRRELGFADDDIVCVYTGRFTADKNPLCLAQAVSKLTTAGHPFRGLFLGDGPQEAAIRTSQGCIVRPFVQFSELARHYRAADIGVWPQEESTSMLDAAACGLPLIVSDRVVAVERIRGNGLTYRQGDVADLVRALSELISGGQRAMLGQVGTEKMQRSFSWRSIAQRRIDDYEEALDRMH